MLLEGGNAVITGSNREIGKAILNKFAENGSNIIAHVRKSIEEFVEYCNQLSEKNHIQIISVCFDFTDSVGMKKGVQKILSVTKKIDILVNNVGIVNNIKLFQMTSIEEIEVNFFKHIELSHNIY